LTHSVNLAFGPQSGFKHKCQARAGFRLQNEARLQLGFAGYLHFEKGLQLCTMAYFNIDCVF